MAGLRVGGEKVETTYKILVLGDSSVGKTCLIHRFCDRAFYEHYISTIGIDYKEKFITLDEKKIQLRIWDTAGQERFRTLTTAYYRGAQGILLVYDLTRTDTFSHLAYWMKNISEMASPDICQVLVGNKADLESDRRIKSDKAKKLADEFKVDFFETSCRTGNNVDDAFVCLAKCINEVRNKKLSDQANADKLSAWPSRERLKKSSWCAC